MQNHSALLLGIDGGATKTVALLADAEGTILARVAVGGSNKQVSGVEATLLTLRHAVEAAFEQARIPVQQVAAACLGLSGVDRPEDLILIRSWADERRLARILTVVNDAQLVVAAGTPDGYGVGLICGTGSIAVGRSIDGRTARAGGWGYLLGDEGSGYDISLKALRAAAQAADGRGHAHTLLNAMLQMWELSNAFDLIPFIYNQADPRAALADVPPLVTRLAEAGDPTCRTILYEAARELADAVIAAANQLGLRGAIPLALAGSVVLRTPQLQQALSAELEQRGRPAQPLTIVDEPTLGALRLARDLYSISV
ncbi:MAG: BadF/BadG/BcrA/BcrD ATPase family protein [Roseiflexaceae bacterium]